MENELLIKASQETELQSFDSAGAIAKKLVYQSPCNFFGLRGYNSSSSDLYIHVFDVAKEPANGDTPNYVLKAPALDNFWLDTTIWGRKMYKGLCVCASTTELTLTLATDKITLNVDFKA